VTTDYAGDTDSEFSGWILLRSIPKSVQSVVVIDRWARRLGVVIRLSGFSDGIRLRRNRNRVHDCR